MSEQIDRVAGVTKLAIAAYIISIICMGVHDIERPGHSPEAGVNCEWGVGDGLPIDLRFFFTSVGLVVTAPGCVAGNLMYEVGVGVERGWDHLRGNDQTATSLLPLLPGLVTAP